MTPPTVRGVINLRGAVVPVIDLAARFGRAPAQRAAQLHRHRRGGRRGRHAPRRWGGMVDGGRVIDIAAAADIEPAPSFGARIRTDFIAGMARREERFVILLEVGRVFSIDRTQAASARSPAPPSTEPVLRRPRMSEISITQAEFEQFRALMHRAAGVDLPPQKISLVSGAWRSGWLRALGSPASATTIAWCRAPARTPTSSSSMVDLLTTHADLFFREPSTSTSSPTACCPALGRRGRCASGARRAVRRGGLHLAMGAGRPSRRRCALGVFGSDISRAWWRGARRRLAR